MGTGVPGGTFEGLIGKQSGHTAPVDGEVVSVSKKNVTIKDTKGKRHKVQLYDNFPLNDAKAVLDSNALVKKGDKVKAGQAVGDTNFTKDGKLALGTNLRVGYVPYKGYNFEDGVISESAAEALKSVHMHKPNLQLKEGDVTSPRRFQIQHPEAFKKAQYESLDDNGVVKVGTHVRPGDPLALATRGVQINDKSGIARLRKAYQGSRATRLLLGKASTEAR